MTTITLTTNLGGHAAGDTIEVTPGTAAFLTDNDYAEMATPSRPKAKAKTKGTPNTTDDDEVGGDSPAESATTAG